MRRSRGKEEKVHSLKVQCKANCGNGEEPLRLRGLIEFHRFAFNLVRTVEREGETTFQSPGRSGRVGKVVRFSAD